MTPIHHINAVIKQLEKKEKQLLPLQTKIMPTVKDIHLPHLTNVDITEQQLGSSKSRTKEQSMLARQLTTDFITALPRSTLLAFTDGSALSNPGPCGAAAIIYVHGMQELPLTYSEPVSKFSTSYHGELEAIRLAMENAYQQHTHRPERSDDLQRLPERNHHSFNPGY